MACNLANKITFITVQHERRPSAGNKTTKNMLTHPTLKASNQTNKQKMTCNVTTKITFMTWLYSMKEGHQQANDKANKTTKTMTLHLKPRLKGNSRILKASINEL